MMIVMEEEAAENQIEEIVAKLDDLGFDVHRSTGSLRTILGAVGGNREFDPRLFEVMEGVHVVYHCAATAHEGLSVFSPYEIGKNNYLASISVFSAAISTLSSFFAAFSNNAVGSLFVFVSSPKSTEGSFTLLFLLLHDLAPSLSNKAEEISPPYLVSKLMF